MVAYSFKRQFIEPIRTRKKRQTIRAERKRHARPGELVQLYSGMRTKHCVLIGVATCLRVTPIRLALAEGFVAIEGMGTLSSPEQLTSFARRDGFQNWPELVAFWTENHPDVDPFSGMLIQWGILKLGGAF